MLYSSDEGRIINDGIMAFGNKNITLTLYS